MSYQFTNVASLINKKYSFIITNFFIYSYCYYDIKNIGSHLFQRYDDLCSIVCQLPMNTLLYHLSRNVLDEIMTSNINSNSGIKISLDKPLNNDICLNILRPAVLRQYYGKDVGNIDGKLKRCTYGSGTGSSSVGMDPNNFVTRGFNEDLIAMTDDIHDLLCNNKRKFNMVGVDLSQKFNHCTILIYYAGEGLKKYSSLGYHTDCVYSPSTGKYSPQSNTQEQNTPAVIYSIGDKRRLNWRCRCVVESQSGKKVWKKRRYQNVFRT